MHYFKTILTLVVLVCFPSPHILQAVVSPGLLKTGIDHGEVSPRHIQATTQYFAKHLQEEGEYNVQKIQQYIASLEEMERTLRRDIYETTLYERLELNVNKFKKARKKALEDSDPTQDNDISYGMLKYVIPKAKHLLQQVQLGMPRATLDATLDDFLRGFVTYYMPNGYRTNWPGDADGTHIVSKAYFPYRFKHRDANKPEATNLHVTRTFQKRISHCLGYQVPLEHYLSDTENRKLTECAFDLSLLDPGISAFWSPPQQPFIAEQNFASIPQEDERIVFKKVSLRSRSSAKIKAFFVRDNKKNDLKIKYSQEVHTDLFASKMMEMIGFSTDEQRYAKKVRVYFEEGDSFESYRSEIANKYGIETIAQFTVAHGRDEHGEWMDLQDVLFEGRPKYEHRLAPFDISSWDLLNRREYRGLIMFAAWIGLHDVQPTNFKQLFHETTDGKLFPIHRLHDPGASLGGRISIRKLGDPFGWGRFYVVNHFHTSFIHPGPDPKTFIVYWNDWANRKVNFQQTTYSDMLWMARKILTYCTKEKLQQAAAASGIPEPIAQIYVHKLLMRQNEIIRSLRLEKEFTPHALADLKHLQLTDEQGPIIQNGRLVRRTFEGQNIPAHLNNNWWTALPALLSFDIPVKRWGERSVASTNATLTGLEGVQAGVGLGGDHADEAKYRLPIGIGTQLIFSRRVRPNSHFLNTGDKIRLYRVEDQVKIQIGLDSPLLEHLIEKIPPLQAGGRLKFYEKYIRHVHYTDSVKQGYASKFEIPRIAANIKQYATHQLGPLDIVRHFDKVGIEFEAHGGIYTAQPFFENGISTGIVALKVGSVHYTRDEYGQLHVYDDRAKKRSMGGGFSIAHLSLGAFKLALFRLFGFSESFTTSVKDYIYPMEDKRRVQSGTPVPLEHHEQELEWLQDVESYQKAEKVAPREEYNYALEAQGKKKGNIFSAGLAFNREKYISESEFTVEPPEDDIQKFYRYEIAYAKYLGWNGGLKDEFATFDIFVNHRTSNRLTLEMEKKEDTNFVIVIRSEDFFASKTKEKVDLLIQHLNHRYSMDTQTPIYKGYRLPPLEEASKYPKVYAITHTFLQGNSLLNGFKELDLQQLRSMLQAHFSPSWFTHNYFHKKIKPHRLVKMASKLKSLALEAETSLQAKQRFGKKMVKFTYELQTDKYGLQLLQALTGQKGLFVMSQVYGLLRSFSSIGDLQQLQRRRFMGESWGKYQVRPVIQRFMRHQRLVRPVLFIEKLYSDRDIFGTLETAINPSFQVAYSHDVQF